MAELTEIARMNVFKYKLDPTVAIPECSVCGAKAKQQTIDVSMLGTRLYSTYQCEVHK